MTRDLKSPLLPLTLGLVALLFFYDIRSYDTFLHLHAGRHVLATRSVPRVDPFSAIARGREWVNHSWLGAVVLYLVHESGGIAAVALFRVAMMAATALVLVLACRRAGGSLSLCCAAALLACAAGRPSVLARPVLFTFLLVSVFLWAPRALTRPAWAAPALWVALTGLWANLHGGVLVGLLIVGAYALSSALAGDHAWRHWLILVLCAAATLCNPFGYKVLAYPLRLAAMPGIVGNITEWLPPSWSAKHVPFGILTALFLLSVAAVTMKDRRAWSRPGFLSSVLLAAAFGAMSCRVQRNMPIFALFAAAASVDGLGPLLARLPNRREVGAAAWCLAACVAAGVICADRSRLGLEVSAGLVPERGLDVVVRHKLHGNVLSEYRWGGYIMWRGGCLDPALRPVIDGRNEVYGEALYDEVNHALELEPGWEQKLEDWGVTLLVFDRVKTGEAIRETGRWRLVHFDDLCVVWAKPAAANKGVVDKLDCTLLDPAGASTRILKREGLARMERGLLMKLSEDPDSAIVTRLLGECALQRRDYPRARDLFAACVRLERRDADIRYHLAYAERRLERHSTALAHYRAAIRLCPTRALYHLGAGQCLARLGRRAEAETRCRRAVELDPSFVPARTQLAVLLFQAGRLAEAQKQLDAIAKVAGPDAARQALERLGPRAVPRPGGPK